MRIMQPFVLEEYKAVTEAVGLLDLSDRGKIRVNGPDRVTFLHSMISNDVEGIADWTGLYATFLTARGKIVSDFYYYKLPEYLIIDIRSDLLIKTIETLEKYIVMDEVDLEDVSATMRHFSVQGPRSPDLLREVFGHAGPSTQYLVQQEDWQGRELWLIGRKELSKAGFDIVLPSEIGDSVREAVLQKGRAFGLREVGPQAHDVLRVEARIPWYGVDMDENRYPMEAQLHEAISLSKGCYIGQEVVAKATHIGGVANLLMGLKFGDSVVPPKDSPVKADGKQIGIVTSAVFSLRLGCPVALAYLKRAFARPGEFYQVEIDKEETIVGEVVEKFI
jgi:folate-binding protein YgfZ